MKRPYWHAVAAPRGGGNFGGQPRQGGQLPPPGIFPMILKGKKEKRGKEEKGENRKKEKGGEKKKNEKSEERKKENKKKKEEKKWRKKERKQTNKKPGYGILRAR